MAIKKDSLGDRMKKYESHYQPRLIDGLPTIIRLDGRSFHTETKKLDRPFDENFRWVMFCLSLKLAKEVGAAAVYTQSDEITLLWVRSKPETHLPFGGRVDKICSLMGGFASAHFNTMIRDEFYGLNKKFSGRTPTFDCRVFQVPSETEAANCFVWREMDAARNAIQLVGQSFFSHKELHGIHTAWIVERLREEKGVDFYKDYDFYARMGHLSVTHQGEDGTKRTYLPANFLSDYEFSLTKCVNKVNVLLGGQEPIYSAGNLPRKRD